MNKTIQRLITLFFIVATVTGHIHAAKQPTRKRPVRVTRTRKRVAPQSPAAKVNKEVSILDQIVEQARIIVMATGTQANKTRANAKKQLNDLMKDLDPKINEVIAEDIEIIKNTTARNKPESQKAYRRLIALVNSINAQANVINTMEEGRKAIELAPAEIKDQVIAQQVQNVQADEAQAVEASRISQIVGGIQSALAAPGRYFFGEDRTAAKTAFEVAVGGAVIGALAYGAYAISPETWQNLYGRMRGTAVQPAPQPEVQPIQPEVQPTLIEIYNPITGELETEAMKAAGARAKEKIIETGTAAYKRAPEFVKEYKLRTKPVTEAIRETGAEASAKIKKARAAAYEYAQPKYEKYVQPTVESAYEYVQPRYKKYVQPTVESAYERAQRVKEAASRYFYPETVEVIYPRPEVTIPTEPGVALGEPSENNLTFEQ